MRPWSEHTDLKQKRRHKPTSRGRSHEHRLLFTANFIKGFSCDGGGGVSHRRRPVTMDTLVTTAFLAYVTVSCRNRIAGTFRRKTKECVKGFLRLSESVWTPPHLHPLPPESVLLPFLWRPGPWLHRSNPPPPLSSTNSPFSSSWTCFSSVVLESCRKTQNNSDLFVRAPEN